MLADRSHARLNAVAHLLGGLALGRSRLIGVASDLPTFRASGLYGGLSSPDTIMIRYIHERGGASWPMIGSRNGDR